MLRIPLYTQVQKGNWSSELRQRTKIRESVDYAKNRRSGVPVTLCDIVITLDQGGYWVDTWGHQTNSRTSATEMVRLLHDSSERKDVRPRVIEARTIYWATLACGRDEWRRCWCPLRKSMIIESTGDAGDEQLKMERDGQNRSNPAAVSCC
uniref:Uncharacterized protein n=1 Tax=Haemonchus contortus TaxID=6289 RepID=A0A7I5EAW5_HAECO